MLEQAQHNKIVFKMAQVYLLKHAFRRHHYRMNINVVVMEISHIHLDLIQVVCQILIVRRLLQALIMLITLYYSMSLDNTLVMWEHNYTISVRRDPHIIFIVFAPLFSHQMVFSNLSYLA